MDAIDERDKRCPTCGRPLDAHDRHVRFVVPEPVLAVPEAERAHKTRGNDVLMMVQGVGSFVRVLLPVRLTGGYTVTFGVWLAVHPDDLRRAWEVWWQPDYASLELDGYLANVIEPWGKEILAAPAIARVRDPERVPYVQSSSNAALDRIINEEWPHEVVLRALDV